MRPQHLNRLISWRAALADTAARLRRPKVTAILCQHCKRWVKPRRYDPTVYACTRCAPQAAHAYYRARRAAADTAHTQRRALDKQLADRHRHTELAAAR